MVSTTVLDLSVKTAETHPTHRSNIMRKLGIHCLLSELVLYAVRNRIDQIAEPVLEDPVGEQSGILPSIGTHVTPAA